MKTIYIVIVVFNEKECTVRCLGELEKVRVNGYTLKTVVVDNASSDGTGREVRRKFPGVYYIYNKTNRGFAAAVNQGLYLALKDKGMSYVLLLNNDTFRLGKAFISKLIKVSLKPGIGIVSPALKHFVGEKLFYGMEGQLNLKIGKASHRNIKNIRSGKLINASFVSGCCMLIKREVLEKVRFFDERYFLYLEDVDYCLQVRKRGYQVVLDPKVVISHKGSASFKNPLGKLPHSFKSNIILVLKWTPSSQKPLALLYCLYFYPSLAILWSLRLLKRSITGEII